jgi:hypothetical protein
MEKQKGKNETFLNNPQQGRMVQLYKPPTINSKHTYSKLKEEKGSEGTRGDKGQ